MQKMWPSANKNHHKYPRWELLMWENAVTGKVKSSLYIFKAFHDKCSNNI